jgi:hypothetical protein
MFRRLVASALALSLARLAEPLVGETILVTKKKKSPAGSAALTIDRRRSNRRTAEAPKGPAAPRPKLERREKVNRRRQIDPTTCERDYTDEEVEFMAALDQYKRHNGRMFPTCSEVLEVIRKLGYVKTAPAPEIEEPSASIA